MTPDEARKRWCPLAVTGIYSSNRHRDGTPAPASYCIADDCMAWRWSLSPRQAERSAAYGKTEPYGYCGLAGAHGN